MADLIALSKQLRRAADHVELYGLVQKKFCPPVEELSVPLGERPTCTAGAVGWALTGRPVVRESDVDVLDALRFVAGHIPGAAPTDPHTGAPDYLEHIAAWNDRPGRTAGEAVALLRLCARDAVECIELSRRINEHGAWNDWSEQSHDDYVAWHLAQGGVLS